MIGTLRAVRDTFLHYLSDNLAYPVRYLRFSKINPSSEIAQEEAVNIAFHLSSTNPSEPSYVQVSVHVISQEENTAEDMRDTVVHLLQAACQTAIFDYSGVSGGGSPVPLHKQLSWDRRILFRPVVDNNYYQYTTLIHLNFVYPASVSSDFS